MRRLLPAKLTAIALGCHALAFVVGIVAIGLRQRELAQLTGGLVTLTAVLLLLQITVPLIYPVRKTE
jgi:hypothetical protein